MFTSTAHIYHEKIDILSLLLVLYEYNIKGSP